MKNRDLLIAIAILGGAYYLSKQRKAAGVDAGTDAAKEKGSNVVLFREPPLPNVKP